MIETKPQAGEWWQHDKDGVLVYFHGLNRHGEMIFELADVGIEVANLEWDGWHHVPDCTGWDWVPPLVPVPGKVVATATVRVTPEMPIGWKCTDCGEFRGHGHEDVCPMAWAELTAPQHILRGCDQMDATGKDVSDTSGAWIGLRGHEGTSIAMWRRCHEIGRCR